ncbi:hypothetical protein PTSG_04510 [Salpingoeca rosetta]|uniref:Putative hydroxypyruvate isomerase n=1 Tax=Salpingoeca rosetta (strain ATCC 50818 / BSB-021) TaxID=946362 RepID=F2U8S5_SALR5|nr:uncharacterized protein PTSG_04510 [Salpingoeca rosetta]EGD72783.1 hypothetical protein PTSG_04510 [Salpingoeca rosetta]|eukprot:XP_004994606.1 hypothetical protein PTSG_04510 [Salpingoeca rosetta]
MPKFSCNLGFFFNSVPLLQRLEKAGAAGFCAVELAFDQYEHDPQIVANACAQHGLHVELINTPKGNWEEGERGLAAIPGKEEEFWAAFTQAVTYAKALSCPKIHVMSGVVPAAVSADACHSVLVSNLQRAVKVAHKEGLMLTLEPISTIPGYYMSTLQRAQRAIEDVDSPVLKYQFDVYHAQRTQGNLAQTLRDNKDILGHIQVAGVPGRHEPDGANEVNFPFLFRVMDDVYDGFVGCEYTPTDAANPDLSWQPAPTST